MPKLNPQNQVTIMQIEITFQFKFQTVHLLLNVKLNLILRIRRGHTICELKISELESIARSFDIKQIYNLRKNA